MEMKLNGVTKLELSKELESHVKLGHMEEVISVIECCLLLPKSKRYDTPIKQKQCGGCKIDSIPTC